MLRHGLVYILFSKLTQPLLSRIRNIKEAIVDALPLDTSHEYALLFERLGQ